MAPTRFSTWLVLPATLWIAAKSGAAQTRIASSPLRPGGVQEPGVTSKQQGRNAPAPSTQMTAWPQRMVDRMATILHFSVRITLFPAPYICKLGQATAPPNAMGSNLHHTTSLVPRSAEVLPGLANFPNTNRVGLCPAMPKRVGIFASMKPPRYAPCHAVPRGSFAISFATLRHQPMSAFPAKADVLDEGTASATDRLQTLPVVNGRVQGQGC